MCFFLSRLAIGGRTALQCECREATTMKTKLIAVLLVAGGSVFAQTRFSIGVHVGAPDYRPTPAPVAVMASRPPCPGAGYVWVDGYYDGYGNWFDGYWALPPYAGAYRGAPRFVEGRFYPGY